MALRGNENLISSDQRRSRNIFWVESLTGFTAAKVHNFQLVSGQEWNFSSIQKLVVRLYRHIWGDYKVSCSHKLRLLPTDCCMNLPKKAHHKKLLKRSVLYHSIPQPVSSYQKGRYYRSLFKEIHLNCRFYKTILGQEASKNNMTPKILLQDGCFDRGNQKIKNLYNKLNKLWSQMFHNKEEILFVLLLSNKMRRSTRL